MGGWLLMVVLGCWPEWPCTRRINARRLRRRGPWLRRPHRIWRIVRWRCCSLESRRIADTVESKRALLAAIQGMPHAEAFLWGHTDSVTKAVFSPDGQTILSAGWDNRIVLWSRYRPTVR